jgi:hypothetical protein
VSNARGGGKFAEYVDIGREDGGCTCVEVDRNCEDSEEFKWHCSKRLLVNDSVLLKFSFPSSSPSLYTIED